MRELLYSLPPVYGPREYQGTKSLGVTIPRERDVIILLVAVLLSGMSWYDLTEMSLVLLSPTLYLYPGSLLHPGSRYIDAELTLTLTVYSIHLYPTCQLATMTTERPTYYGEAYVTARP
jgi:hypothetical protein